MALWGVSLGAPCAARKDRDGGEADLPDEDGGGASPSSPVQLPIQMSEGLMTPCRRPSSPAPAVPLEDDDLLWGVIVRIPPLLLPPPRLPRLQAVAPPHLRPRPLLLPRPPQDSSPARLLHIQCLILFPSHAGPA
uniref:Uncharacterized protein n=1 Tax=Arundo donax TaxID=35708 RepID=A0A0A9AYS2_ARUDO